MKPRDRVLAAFEHREPDRVPIDLGGNVTSIHRVAYQRLLKHLGLPADTITIADKVQQIVYPHEEVLKLFGVDFRRVALRPGSKADFRDRYDHPSGRPYFVDEWGIKWGKNPLYYDIIEHPLARAEVEDLDNYDWPDPYDPARVEGLEREAKALYEETDYAVVAFSAGCAFFEIAWGLRGFQRLLMDMHVNPRFVDHLLDRLLKLFLGFYDVYLGAVGPYVQMIQFGDDYGMQNGPILSPRLFKRFIKPRLKRLYDYVHSHSEGLICHHTCGSVYELIPDLIEAGVDVLNPVQPRAAKMDGEVLKREFGQQLVFHGGVDIQRVLPFGTPQDVEAEARRVLKALGPGGGYVFAGAHNIQSDTSPENIVTLFKAGRRFGRYPLGF